MNPATRLLLTDVKAAARIGHPASLEAALEGLQQYPEVAANAPMGDEFLQQVILPIGHILAASRFDSTVFQPYLNNPLAAGRALAAVIFAARFVQAPDLHRSSLDRLAADSRADVRQALSLSLSPFAEVAHPQIAPVLDAWLSSDSPRLQQVAVATIPHFPLDHIGSLLPSLTPISANPDSELRAALAEALTLVALKGLSSQVLSLLQDWSQVASPNAWVISRVLSGAWAAEDPAPALDLLHTLARSGAEPRHLATALKALIRHGAADAVQAELSRWRSIDNHALQALGSRLEKQLSNT